jgi:hypothetical protein
MHVIIIIIIIRRRRRRRRKCRRYQLFNATKDHVISTCPNVAKEQHRHDRIYAKYSLTYGRK